MKFCISGSLNISSRLRKEIWKLFGYTTVGDLLVCSRFAIHMFSYFELHSLADFSSHTHTHTLATFVLFMHYENQMKWKYSMFGGVFVCANAQYFKTWNLHTLTKTKWNYPFSRANLRGSDKVGGRMKRRRIELYRVTTQWKTHNNNNGNVTNNLNWTVRDSLRRLFFMAKMKIYSYLDFCMVNVRAHTHKTKVKCIKPRGHILLVYWVCNYVCILHIYACGTKFSEFTLRLFISKSEEKKMNGIKWKCNRKTCDIYMEWSNV